MASFIGKIGEVDGKFYAKGADGSLRELFEGDKIFEGESIVGDKANSGIDSVVVSLIDGSEPFVVLGNETQFFDSSLIETTEFSPTETVSKPSSISSILEESGEEINLDDIETAAGEDGGVSSSDAGEAAFDVHNDVAVDVTAELRENPIVNAGEGQEVDEELSEAELARLAEEANRRENTGIGSDTDADSDSETDDETETDLDSDNDTDEETDSDDETDSDSDNDTDEETDSDDETDADSDSDPDSENQNPGNDKEVGKSPFDGIKGEEPSSQSEEDNLNIFNSPLLGSGDESIPLCEFKTDEAGKYDLSNNKMDKLELSLEDVLDMSDDSNFLEITGDKQDKIELESNVWTQEGTNDGFKEYRSNEDPTVTLKIDDDIKVDGF